MKKQDGRVSGDFFLAMAAIGMITALLAAVLAKTLELPMPAWVLALAVIWPFLAFSALVALFAIVAMAMGCWERRHQQR